MDANAINAVGTDDSDIVADPGDPSSRIAGAWFEGVFVSTDGGATWTTDKRRPGGYRRLQPRLRGRDISPVVYILSRARPRTLICLSVTLWLVHNLGPV